MERVVKRLREVDGELEDLRMRIAELEREQDRLVALLPLPDDYDDAR